MSDRSGFNRRHLLKFTGLGATGLILGAGGAAGATGAAGLPGPSPVDTGRVENGAVKFPPWRAPADTPSAPPPTPLPPDRRVGFAVVGLGRLALEEVLPAFAECGKAKVVSLVSGTPEKLKVTAAQYGIDPASCTDYAGFDRIRDDPSIRAVYVILPNGLHREFVERAARAGKHVLCEKPMATNSADARAMVASCAEAGVRLMIAYRIHYQPHNLRLRRLIEEAAFGRLVAIHGVNVQTVAENGAEQWRHKRAMSGGGSLPDIGLYCLNTARFLTGEEPSEVSATIESPKDDPRFREVEETVSFTLRFPSGTIANNFCSYGARDDKYQRLNFATAAVDMPNAYSYEGQELYVSRREGDLTTRQELVIPPKNQFAEEIDHFAECVLENKPPRTPGEEGVKDHVLMEAIYGAAEEKRPIAL